MEELLRDILLELKEINSSVSQLAAAAPLTQPLYDLDDIYTKLDEVADQITGPLGYNLGDIHGKLNDIEINTN